MASKNRTFSSYFQMVLLYVHVSVIIHESVMSIYLDKLPHVQIGLNQLPIFRCLFKRAVLDNVISQRELTTVCLQIQKYSNHLNTRLI